MLNLVLLHGWGLHAGIWSGVASALESQHRVHCLDLPGFGSAAPLARYSSTGLAERIAEQAPADAIWIGWSLGGLVALQAAALGAPMRKLVLVGSTPRFVQDSDWPHAIAADVLNGFASELARDWRGTVLRFLALQARGSEQAKAELRTLRETVFARGEPSTHALAGGLDVLRDTDLRSELARIEVPTLVLHGERDLLAPMGAAQTMTRALPQARLAAIAGAGHAPFLSHSDRFNAELMGFLNE